MRRLFQKSQSVCYLPFSMVTSSAGSRGRVQPNTLDILKSTYNLEFVPLFQTEGFDIAILNRCQTRDPLRALLNILHNAKTFRSQGLEALIVEAPIAIDIDRKPLFCSTLKNVWASKIDIFMRIDAATVISFNRIAEVVSTDEFIKIYANAILNNSIPCSRKIANSRQAADALNFSTPEFTIKQKSCDTIA